MTNEFNFFKKQLEHVVSPQNTGTYMNRIIIWSMQNPIKYFSPNRKLHVDLKGALCFVF